MDADWFSLGQALCDGVETVKWRNMDDVLQAASLVLSVHKAARKEVFDKETAQSINGGDNGSSYGLCDASGRLLCCFYVMGHDAGGISSHTHAVLLTGLSRHTYCHFEAQSASIQQQSAETSFSPRRCLQFVSTCHCSQVQSGHFACLEFRAMRISKFVKYLCVMIGLQGHPHSSAQPLCSFCPVCGGISASTQSLVLKLAAFKIYAILVLCNIGSQAAPNRKDLRAEATALQNMTSGSLNAMTNMGKSLVRWWIWWESAPSAWSLDADLPLAPLPSCKVLPPYKWRATTAWHP